MKKSLFFFIALVWITIAACTKDGGKALYTPGSGVGGSMARFTIQGSYLYTVDKSYLKVYSLADGANPILKSDNEAGFEIETIFPFKDKLFLGRQASFTYFPLKILSILKN